MTDEEGEDETFWLLVAVVTASVVGSAFIVMDVIGGASSSSVDGIGEMAAAPAAQVVVVDDVVSFNTTY